MNSLQGTTSAATTADPDSEHRKLEFEYPVSEATEAIKKLGRPVVEQERELEEGRRAVEGGRKVQGAEGCGEEAMVRKGAEGSGGAAGAKGGRKEKIGQFEVSLLCTETCRPACMKHDRDRMYIIPKDMGNMHHG